MNRKCKNNLFLFGFVLMIIQGCAYSGNIGEPGYMDVDLDPRAVIDENDKSQDERALEETADLPDTRYERAYIDQNTDDGVNLGPNSPGYIGPDGQYNMYPEIDPR